MLNLNPTHRYVTNMLRDQGPASIEVGDAKKEASRQGGLLESSGFEGHEREVVEDRGNRSRRTPTTLWRIVILLEIFLLLGRVGYDLCKGLKLKFISTKNWKPGTKLVIRVHITKINK